MNEKSKIALEKVIAEYAECIATEPGQKHRFPKAIADKVIMLKKSGIGVGTMASSFRVSRALIYQWLKVEKVAAGISATPKRLRLVKEPVVVTKTAIESSFDRLAYGRLIFKSGLHLELRIDSIDVQFLNLLNEMG